MTPSAMPVGRIVTLWSGSANSSTYAHTAWPPSWYATISFSSSDSASDSRSQPHQHAIARGVEVLLVHLVRVAAHREQGGLVHEVREVGAAHARRAARDDLDAHVGRDLLVAEVDLEDLDPLVLGGQRHHDHAVEAARAQQGGVEDVGTVGGRHHHDALGRLEAVHLGEHLVERLLALVVPAAETGAALAADRVDLVDEDDRGSLLARGLEEVAHPRRADTDEHLHEVGAGDRDERHAGLARDRRAR